MIDRAMIDRTVINRTATGRKPDGLAPRRRHVNHGGGRTPTPAARNAVA